MRFDDRQRRHLQPLAEHDVVLFAFFFANTFPLAFHYNGIDSVAARLLVQTANWNQSPIEQGMGDPHLSLFYAVTRRIAQIETPLSLAGKRLDTVPFSVYRPRYVFFPHSDRLCHIAHKNELVTAASLREIVDDYDFCELYSDTAEQADAVATFLERSGCPPIHRMFRDERIPLSPLPMKETGLPLFYVGAPLSMLFLSKPEEYVAFQLDSGVVEIRDLFDTYLCIVSDDTVSDETVRSIREAVEHYHADLFENAKDPTRGTSFTELGFAFNRYARQAYKATVFQNPSMYARCLMDHHAGVPIPYASQVSVPQ